MATFPAKPVITTIIPTYRRPVLLRRAILSALHQTYPHVRVCVYDNASGDETESVVDETESVVKEIARHDPRVKYHRHPRNIGSYNNFNYGIREVETEFFSLLSDDDVL
ncbi:MAG: glycosyltransferase, partial [Gallionella sp.]|nr:glycosyltransferase [Gallionella sp.]